MQVTNLEVHGMTTSWPSMMPTSKEFSHLYTKFRPLLPLSKRPSPTPSRGASTKRDSGNFRIPEAVKTTVSNKLGVGILYQGLLKETNGRGSFKQLRVSGLSMEGKAYIVCHKERPLSPCSEAFLKLLREWCEAKRNKTRDKEHILLAPSFIWSMELMNSCPLFWPGLRCKDYFTC